MQKVKKYQYLLTEEIDLLEIVKKLRVHQFASQQTLKPYQRDLVNFFQDYKLQDTSKKTKVKPEDFSVLMDNAT